MDRLCIHVVWGQFSSNESRGKTLEFSLASLVFENFIECDKGILLALHLIVLSSCSLNVAFVKPLLYHDPTFNIQQHQVSFQLMARVVVWEYVINVHYYVQVGGPMPIYDIPH